jgi:hypothetical protein
MLKRALNAYRNRAIATQEIVEDLEAALQQFAAIGGYLSPNFK